MTIEKASNIWQIIKAYGEGKTIQIRHTSVRKLDCWIDIHEPIDFDDDDYEYRIKPEESPCGRCIDSGKEIDCGKCTRDEALTENYIIEQNCGENRVEGGVLSISGSVSKKHYRPFKDCNELIETYCEKWEEETGYSWAENPVKLAVPYIWLSHKKVNAKKLIISYDYIPELEEDVVELGSMNYTMKELFELWEFLDGSPVGKLEE